MKDYIQTLPQWVLIGLLLFTGAVTAWAAQQHIAVDEQQSSDITSLAATVSNLAVVVEYNYKVVEENKSTTKENNELIRDTQMRLERILGRIESQLKEND